MTGRSVRPSKISRDELLQRCARTFKRHGYHGTTMDTLAQACDLTKAAFYHHYPNKDSLLRDVLAWSHERVSQTLFALAYDESKPAAQRLAMMGERAKRLFQDDSIGCLMGVVAVDAAYGNQALMEPIRHFMDDWANAFSHLLGERHGTAQAPQLARQLVADFEGAILLARIYNDTRYINRVCARALRELSDTQ